ncbi:hypothetical protein PUNSTDRAFT_50928 [Punctularia strigosozonata HHB-11173 SS5]|uniref:uncharacterized protein n=1 Tax=Punctularia strigosozonata (strain HHB-11173) TaxID=741275 RepID=UPI0004416C69|nr:uncharacterized protein PUNSTDRAFT_50928 [Punctularia strigosozonata HHB-11173 SS5]EIN10252.1 hypothetical protein PUNSTDRAFT_50928 [Punctularia strigosozonata HHB-11173 SS5]
MSITVDDLVASFGSSHIGQEAMDLAALQSQLAQTLFAHALPQQHSQSIPNREIGYQPCNTPIACTPTSPTGSFPWSQMRTERRSASLCSRRSVDDSMLTDDEDERLVEEQLLGGSSSTTTAAPSQQHQMQTSWSAALDEQQQQHSSSLFATTDPFYVAASNPAPAAPSVFAQVGRPSQQSPFLAQQTQPFGGSQAHAAPNPYFAQQTPRLGIAPQQRSLFVTGA